MGIRPVINKQKKEQHRQSQQLGSLEVTLSTRLECQFSPFLMARNLMTRMRRMIEFLQHFKGKNVMLGIGPNF